MAARWPHLFLFAFHFIVSGVLNIKTCCRISTLCQRSLDTSLPSICYVYTDSLVNLRSSISAMSSAYECHIIRTAIYSAKHEAVSLLQSLRQLKSNGPHPRLLTVGAANSIVCCSWYLSFCIAFVTYHQVGG
jgi:hypothetical protein